MILKSAENIAGEKDGFTLLRNDHATIDFINELYVNALLHAAEVVRELQKSKDLSQTVALAIAARAIESIAAKLKEGK